MTPHPLQVIGTASGTLNLMHWPVAIFRQGFGNLG
jgi:hypothetical protein